MQISLLDKNHDKYINYDTQHFHYRAFKNKLQLTKEV